MKSRRKKLSSSRSSYTFRAAGMFGFISLLIIAFASTAAATELRNIDSINTTVGGKLNISADTTFDNYTVDNISELKLNNGLSFGGYTINDSQAISPVLSYDAGSNEWFMEGQNLNLDSQTAYNAEEIRGSTGTTTDPLYTFSSDTNTGIYSPNSNEIALTTNGNRGLELTSDSKVQVVNGNLQLGSNSISQISKLYDNGTTDNFFEDSCSDGDIITGINADGSLDCTSTGDQVTDLWVNESGDTMQGALNMTGDQIVQIGSSRSNFTSSGGLDLGSRADLGNNIIQDVSQLQNQESVDVDIDSDAGSTDSESFEITADGETTDLVRVYENGTTEIIEGNLSLKGDYLKEVEEIQLTSGTTINGSFDIENSNITLNENWLKNATGVTTDKLLSPSDATIVDVESELSLNDNAVKDVSDLELNAGADIRTDGTDAIQINSDQDLTIPNGNISMSNNDIIEVDELRTGGGGSDVIAVRDANNEEDIIRFNEGGDVAVPPGNLSLGGNDLNSVDQIRVTDSSDPAGKQLIQVGDEVYLTDVDTSNTLGVYGQGDNNVGNIQLGSSGPTLEGQSDGDTNISGKVIVGGDQLTDSSDTDILTANIGGQRNFDDGSGNALLTVGGDVSSSTAGRVTVGDSTGTDTARFLDNNRLVVPNNNLTLGDGSGNEDFEINTDGSSSVRLSFQESGTTELQYRYDASNDRVQLYNPQGGNDVIRLNENGNVTVPSGALTLAGSSLDFTQGIGGNELEYDSSVEEFSIYDTDLSANAIAADGTAVRLRDPNGDEQAINIQSTQTQITNQPLIFDGENLDMNGSQIKNVDTLGNGTTRTIELESDGDVEIPNGDLNMSQNRIYGGADSDIAFGNNDPQDIVANVSSGGQYEVYNSGSRIYYANGNNLVMDSGKLNMNSNNITNYWDNNICGNARAVQKIYRNGTVVCTPEIEFTVNTENLSDTLEAGNVANQSINMDYNRIGNVSELNISTSSSQIASFEESGVTISQPLSVESSGPLSVANGVDLTDPTSNTIDSYSTLYLSTSSGSPSDIVLQPTGDVGVQANLSVTGDLDLSDNDLKNVGGTQCADNEFVDGQGQCEDVSSAGGSDDQNLSEVLVQGNVANQTIEMDGNDIDNVSKISGDSGPVSVSNDVSMTGSSPEIDMGSGMSVQRTGGDLVISD